ncbi:NAD(+)--rifampin ADP-ribosyltransferase [Nocardioides panzhihuensis]|uniref:NAD(+)--rifampin ADP-ribosyltransferase n=1 Tax=Nocardioides panzhihuensis TaxID=860243 RepID=UPI003CCE44A7
MSIVDPTAGFEDDPNVTNRKLPHEPDASLQSGESVQRLRLTISAINSRLQPSAAASAP